MLACGPGDSSVAAGSGITQLEVEMMYTTPSPGLNPSIGKSAASGAVATMAAKSSCLEPLSPIAAPGKFVVRAVKGSGVAAGRLYPK